MSSVPPDQEPPVPSPCIKTCLLDEASVCRGCHRTMAEIVAWRWSSNAERRAVLQRCAARRRRSPEPPGP